MGITSTPRYKIKGVPHPGRVEFKVVVEIFSRPRVLYRHQGPDFRASISDVVPDATYRPSLLRAITTRVNWRTPSTASYLSERRTNSGPLGDKGCPHNGYGTLPGCDGGAEHPSTGHLVRDRVSPHPAVFLGCHHPRVPEDGRGPGQ
jgi:hypothetical protein